MAGTAPMAAYCHSPEGSAFRIAIPDVKYRISRSSPASLSQPFSLAYQMGNASNSSIHAVLFGFLVRGRLNFGYYFINIILPETIFTVVTTLILYRLFLYISRKLEEMEKRRDTTIV